MYVNKKLLLVVLVGFLAATLGSLLWADDPELAKKSTLETIKARKRLLVCAEIPYTPFEFKDEKGNVVGYDVDVARLLAKFAGVAFDPNKDMLHTGFDIILAELRKGKCDIILSGMTRTLERALEVNFSQGYLDAGQVAGVSRARQPNLTRYEQLNDARIIIAVQLGTTGEIAARQEFPKAQIKPFDNAEVAVAEVAAGRADAIIFDDVFLKVIVPQKFKATIFLCCPPTDVKLLTVEKLGIAMRKGDPDFQTWLDLFLEQLKTVVTVDADLIKEFNLDPKFLGKPLLTALEHRWFVRYAETGR